VQDALDAPRFCISAGMPDSEVKDAASAGDINSEVYFEEGIDPKVVEELQSTLYRIKLCRLRLDYLGMGHDARMVHGYARGLMGRGQIIQRLVDRSGKTVWAGGSDPRIDGHVVAQI
jgi:gamma-glutamyltranspeptidase/glutathione hydrolase